MVAEVAVGLELFVAALIGAFVRLFPCVDTVVDFQVAFFVEGSAAFLAREWYVSSLFNLKIFIFMFVFKII